MLPEWQALEGREFESMLANLSFTDVVATDSRPRFLIRYHGARIGEAYGSDCHGKYLDEILPANFRNAALATYWQVVETRHPVYTAVDTPTAMAASCTTNVSCSRSGATGGMWTAF